VRWNKRDQKWFGSVFDRLATAAAAGKKKMKFTSNPFGFESQAECTEAVELLRQIEEEEFNAVVYHRIAADPLVRGLPRAGDAETAPKGVVHCHVEPHGKYWPWRAVTSGKIWVRACEKCAQLAYDADGNTNTKSAHFCVQHGGGRRCPGSAGCGGICPLGHAVNPTDRYDGQCCNCFCVDHPDSEKAKAARSFVHVREQAVFNVLKRAFPDYNFIFDKGYGFRTRLTGRLTRLRPDARVNLADRVIIVECDENSHRHVPCASEREKEASSVRQAAGEKTVVVIRLNPDSYTDYDGKKHPSCFAQLGVAAKQKKQWEHRAQTLVNTVTYIADPDNTLPPNIDTDRPCLTIELFYDLVSATPEAERLRDAAARFRAIGKGKKRLREATASAPAAESSDSD
jgi:hypothetical protein